ncbi:MAG TPA: hypothetical protein VEI97_01295, partial [bacterium]|nr:hypothetical protein [bacterium]
MQFLGESGGYLVNQISASTLSFRVADWDARATETTEADLAVDTDPTHVAIGESGIPTLSVSIPGVTGDPTSTVDMTAGALDDDSVFGGDAGADSGQPGDALFFSEAVSKAVISGQTAGTYTGMVKVTDPENGVATDWSFPLDPDLGLLTSDLPDAVVYQSFQVDLETLPPAATSWNVTTGTVLSGGTASINIAGISDPESEPVDVLVDWDNDGVYTVATTANSPYPANLPLVSPITYTHSGVDPDVRTLKVRLTDGSNTVDLLPNQTFTITNCPGLTYAGFTLGGSPGGSGGGYTPSGMTVPTLDMATYPRYNNTWPNGAHIIQNVTSTSHNLWAYTHTTTLVSSQMAITNFGASLNKRTHQIEVDMAGRVLFATVSTGYTPSSAFGDPASIYAAAGAEPNFHWFDYATPAGPAVTTFNTVNTGTARVIAMTVDQSGNVYFIDQDHILHKYTKGPGTSGYTESTAAPYPWNLMTTLGDPNGAAGTDSNRKVGDLIFNFRNRNIFILTQSQGASPNARLHRLECDGTILPTVAGNPNPNVFSLTTLNTTQTWTIDLCIDQLGTDGSVLTNQGEAQMIVTQSQGISGGATGQ